MSAGEPPEGERKLFLLIEAPTEAQVGARQHHWDVLVLLVLTGRYVDLLWMVLVLKVVLPPAVHRGCCLAHSVALISRLGGFCVPCGSLRPGIWCLGGWQCTCQLAF